jgi:hypothetical protein
VCGQVGAIKAAVGEGQRELLPRLLQPEQGFNMRPYIPATGRIQSMKPGILLLCALILAACSRQRRLACYDGPASPPPSLLFLYETQAAEYCPVHKATLNRTTVPVFIRVEQLFFCKIVFSGRLVSSFPG